MVLIRAVTAFWSESLIVNSVVLEGWRVDVRTAVLSHLHAEPKTCLWLSVARQLVVKFMTILLLSATDNSPSHRGYCGPCIQRQLCSATALLPQRLHRIGVERGNQGRIGLHATGNRTEPLPLGPQILPQVKGMGQ